MIRKFLAVLIIILFVQTAYAMEDCIISTDGKLTDISIEHNDIIDVYPLITIMNEKNTLIVHPLREGKTSFSVLKNGRDKKTFNVKVTPSNTFIEAVEGFEIMPLDNPPDNYEYELDIPPEISKE